MDIAVIIVTYKSAQLATKSRNGTGIKVRVVVVDKASGDFDEIARAIDANNCSSWVTLMPA